MNLKNSNLMKLSRRSVLRLCGLLPLSASLRSQNLPGNLRLGFTGCSPAVFFPLQPAMIVKISEIVYARNGMLESFREELSFGDARPIVLIAAVNLSKWTGMCSSLEYSVEVAGRKQTSPKYDAFDDSKLTRTLAFSPEAVGVILGGGPLETDLKTEMGYDEKGRQYIQRQVLGIGGLTYQVTYSDYRYAGPPTGKIFSYSARITVLRS